MKYPCIDGTILESIPDNSVTYTCPALGLSNGTLTSYETSSRTDNTLQQIKIIRVIENEQMTVTITEQTESEIQQYFANL
jgi:hypothetical protein